MAAIISVRLGYSELWRHEFEYFYFNYRNKDFRTAKIAIWKPYLQSATFWVPRVRLFTDFHAGYKCTKGEYCIFPHILSKKGWPERGGGKKRGIERGARGIESVMSSQGKRMRVRVVKVWEDERVSEWEYLERKRWTYFTKLGAYVRKVTFRGLMECIQYVTYVYFWLYRDIQKCLFDNLTTEEIPMRSRMHIKI